MFERYKVIHFVGIGGVGMSGIAEVLSNLGYKVTGSDLRESETTRRLRDMGIQVYISHKAENIDSAHVVVVSSAVREDNPEVLEAKRRAVPAIPRAEMLAELARLKYGILVAGAHGKTTTTSLISTVLGHGGLDPTIIIGGKLKGIGSNARLGRGDFLVAEADESDGSFLTLSPTIAVVTNIDREHMDFFKSMETLSAAFLSFVNKVPFYGVAFLCAENDRLREIMPRIHRRFVTYGFSASCDIIADRVEKAFMSTSFDVSYRSKNLGRFTLPTPGMHNVLNSLACIGVGLELQMSVHDIRDALASFSGIQRRFEFKGEAKGVRVYDDYGHHPTEVRATIAAAKDNLAYLSGSPRLFVVFQPHRYTRTADLMDTFSSSFAGADRLVLLDIYPAGERPIPGITSQTLFDRVAKEGQAGVVYEKDRDEAVGRLAAELRSGDILLTLGAGDVWKMGEAVLERLHD
ncbi:MAG: UDP-N-acetylmuramate--L-alanine ligase [Nitrospiraceae bacterium]|nr:UDP-N-acetylmuramate--L-alanine ligase [Nitrospiraceae bacterium]